MIGTLPETTVALAVIAMRSGINLMDINVVCF